MQKTIASILLLVCLASNTFSQESLNPVQFLKGYWLLKVTNVQPAATEDKQTMDNRLIQFSSILDDKGLIQTTYEKYGEVEVYYFYDSAKGILYGTTVDDNGYVWQTQMGVNSNGRFDITTGGPINDTSIKVKSELNIISDNEMKFKHSEFKDGKEVILAEGIFHRIPDWAALRLKE